MDPNDISGLFLNHCSVVTGLPMLQASAAEDCYCLMSGPGSQLSLCYKVFRSARSTEPHLVTSRALKPISEIMDTHSFLEDNPVRLILDIQSCSPTVTLHGVAVISEIYLQVWVSMQSLPDWLSGSLTLTAQAAAVSHKPIFPACDWLTAALF